MPPILLLLLTVIALQACRREPAPPPQTSTEVTGNVAERVAAVQKVLHVLPPLANTIRDAHALEERIGDGRLGPSDFTNFQSLHVAPSDVALWRAALAPLAVPSDSPNYTEPAQPVSWWVAGPEFASLEFFSAQTLTGRSTGWVGMHAASGAIYIYSFTQ
jgi:hypothetical protein